MSKYKICLTGGIASGKTAVSDMLGLLGVNVIDADVLAREVVKLGSAGLQSIFDSFGSSVIQDDGTLDRGELKRVVFNDKFKLDLLNSIIHPLVREAFLLHSRQSEEEIEVWVIPLISRKNEYGYFNRILAIDVDREVQLNRIVQRDSINMDTAVSIIDSQPSRSQRLNMASDVIRNNAEYKILVANVKMYFHMVAQEAATYSKQIKSCRI